MQDGKLFELATNPKQYDSENLDWSDQHDLKSPSRRFAWSFIFKESDLFENKDVLDIGAGVGWLISEIKKMHPKSITAIEPSKKNFSFLEEKHSDIELYNDSLESFQTTNQFDTITMVWVTSHIANIEDAFKKVSQYLNVGGKFLTVNLDYDYGRMERHGYEMEINIINDSTFVALTTRSHGKMADIYRTNEKYTETGNKVGLKLVKNIPMKPSQELINKRPKYEAFQDQAISNLMIFQKL